ncbi:hypothetical protein NDU88_001216 [Pleurodeles waltl]|uniref:Uncharacterized protein n=1 Tax=Pleurodeles waltl TaxID=8319 RepID=A0AAV7P3G9_PLEWA|nr:hypothetical protein NDU88_001216 [Pleurodeles waltl]
MTNPEPHGVSSAPTPTAFSNRAILLLDAHPQCRSYRCAAPCVVFFLDELVDQHCAELYFLLTPQGINRLSRAPVKWCEAAKGSVWCEGTRVVRGCEVELVPLHTRSSNTRAKATEEGREVFRKRTAWLSPCAPLHTRSYNTSDQAIKEGHKVFYKCLCRLSPRQSSGRIH